MSVDKCVFCGADLSDLSRHVCANCEAYGGEMARAVENMRAQALENWTRRQMELDRLAAQGYYRTRTVTAFQKIKEVRSHAPVR